VRAEASVAEIDRLNILQATLLAMQRAVAGLPNTTGRCLGRRQPLPQWAWRSQAVVKGDDKVAAIAAASILAKTARDQYMCRLHDDYPAYGFARHMGYGTAAHLAALQAHGACPQHRRSFSPVKSLFQ